MHTMSAQDKLRLHLADKTVTWREDVPGAAIARTPDAVFVAFSGPATAAAVIDAYNIGRGARVTLVHDGPVGDVARRSAARFGVALLDAATLPEPAPQVSRQLPDAPPVHLADALAPPPTPAFPVAKPELLLPAHVEAAPAPEPVPQVSRQVRPALVPALPWDAGTPPTDPFPPAQGVVEVTPHEILAMPWTLHPDTPVEEHVEVTQSRRGPRGTLRPTTDLHPDARHWGLPWPRPVAPTDGLAIADPKLWNNPARLESLHAGFDARATGLAVPSAPAPEAGWLKKLQLDGVK